MIKKFFHFLWATIFSILFTTIALLLLYWFIWNIYRINILSPETYKNIADYWNSDGVLHGNDLLLLSLLLAFIPFNFIVWRKIFCSKLINLIVIPLNWLINLGFKNYKAPNINIKNLKVEERKDLEQFVRERVDIENKKHPQMDSSALRREIIEKIEKEKNE